VLSTQGQEKLVDLDCVIDRLRGELSDEQIEVAARAAGKGEEVPPEVVDAAYAAGRECATG